MASEFENLFDRLPTELIISILEKISDVKCLCVCYSVSKRFVTLVPQTRSVSVQMPSVIGSSDEVLQVWPRGMMNFLKKLCCVEYVTIRFTPRDPSIQGPLFRWKSDSSRLILVAAKNRSTGDSAVESTRALTTHEYYYALSDLIANHVYHSRMRGVHIKELLPVLPNLKKVSAVESAEQGSFVWEEDIDSMKRVVRWSEDNHVFCLKMWSAPLVELPMSGCAMTNVTLISIREMEGPHGFMDENSLEETEYRELAMIMKKEYPHQESNFPALCFKTRIGIIASCFVVLLNLLP